jgi:AcrR family transcriptional regulator
MLGDERRKETPVTNGATRGRPVGSNGQDTRRRILAATMQCVAELGYARATIREIARAADMTSGSLYHYFPNKAELVKATYVEVSEATMPGLAAAAGQADGFMAKLVAVIHHGGQIVQEYPYVGPFDRAVRAPGVAETGLSRVSDDIFGSLRGIVEDMTRQAQADGELSREVTAEDAANAVFALMRGIYDYIASSPPADIPATLHAVELMLQGNLLGVRTFS